MDIKINNIEAARNDAKDVTRMVSSIRADLDELNKAINDYIPDYILTDWSESLKSDWLNYFKADIPEALADMQLTATNIDMAVEKALEYSK